ncbi:hypothetical protein, variant [Cryptococcus amylolentus CBS 6039]|uniref:Uncharacterized protein n=1 Tax=Cryptococcus amylolentus CBS 6039 TaxID=1295533 RepID=A0A1E3I283_9TREE|nr:hypothetical protein, variant [Cryptococcus amylolentus CBS 6039]ODN82106.1 hypothetical protein, variant [Cryptococcus amylolentus CBS 6039]
MWACIETSLHCLLAKSSNPPAHPFKALSFSENTMASVLRSLRSGSSSAASFARSNRSNPQALRSSRRQYSSPKQSQSKLEEPVLPPLSEMMSRKSIMAAWSGKSRLALYRHDGARLTAPSR